ncbi:nucleotidyltransferase domain-containing protein [Geothrix paludis]|uniref:nucleotidyltransferase domain-containing protein n=1 Tax=Geothrix paludis TaxID=2922722 RepID=UPI001FABEB20|nr:nucleotidyltransferase domain-containing protein [Geothrix paludis]
MKLPEELIQELVARLVEAVHPTRIILFGSAARGEMGPHSDIDLLVVVPDGVSQKEAWNRAYQGLRRFPYAKDLIVVQEGFLEAHRNTLGMVYCEALREGQEIFHAA